MQELHETSIKTSSTHRPYLKSRDAMSKTLSLRSFIKTILD